MSNHICLNVLIVDPPDSGFLEVLKEKDHYNNRVIPFQMFSMPAELMINMKKTYDVNQKCDTVLALEDESEESSKNLEVVLEQL